MLPVIILIFFFFRMFVVWMLRWKWIVHTHTYTHAHAHDAIRSTNTLNLYTISFWNDCVSMGYEGWMGDGIPMWYLHCRMQRSNKKRYIFAPWLISFSYFCCCVFFTSLIRRSSSLTSWSLLGGDKLPLIFSKWCRLISSLIPSRLGAFMHMARWE